jgi:hypothetical protein
MVGLTKNSRTDHHTLETLERAKECERKEEEGCCCSRARKAAATAFAKGLKVECIGPIGCCSSAGPFCSICACAMREKFARQSCWVRSSRGKELAGKEE